MKAKQVRFVHICSFFLFFPLLDYKKGFGGTFGVQSDRKDKSAVGWDHQEKSTPHESQNTGLYFQRFILNGNFQIDEFI
jgi:hypothetical protein